MVQWLDVRKQGGRGAVSANYVLKWLTWTMHCNYTVLKKISETCYPPSLFGKSLLELVYMGRTHGVETPITPDEPDVLDAGGGVRGASPSELLIFFAKSAQLHSAKTDETNFGGFGTIRMACFPGFTISVYIRRS